jgi:hypothetical protein
MDAAFNQPASTTPRRNWQLDQCYREGCKLERELTAATEQRDRLAEALRELCETLLADKPRDITELLNKAGDALAAAKL